VPSTGDASCAKLASSSHLASPEVATPLPATLLTRAGHADPPSPGGEGGGPPPSPPLSPWDPLGNRSLSPVPRLPGPLPSLHPPAATSPWGRGEGRGPIPQRQPPLVCIAPASGYSPFSVPRDPGVRGTHPEGSDRNSLEGGHTGRIPFQSFQPSCEPTPTETLLSAPIGISLSPVTLSDPTLRQGPCTRSFRRQEKSAPALYKAAGTSCFQLQASPSLLLSTPAAGTSPTLPHTAPTLPPHCPTLPHTASISLATLPHTASTSPHYTAPTLPPSPWPQLQWCGYPPPLCA